MVFLLIAFALLVAFVLFMGGFEVVGEMILKLLPRHVLKQGDSVHVYINGDYNRTARIDKVDDGNLYVYISVPLPIGFRGRFYATGVDSNGNKLVYIAYHKHYKFMRAAEAVRKFFNVCDDEEQLLPTDGIEDDEPQSDIKEADDEV